MGLMGRMHAILFMGLVGTALIVPTPASAQADVRHGQYVVQAAGCVGCHTDNKAGAVPFAGGRALKTPFGVFYGPNITPDRETGLGSWTEADFKRAIRQGERRDGSHYFPAFPYPSFTGMADSDIRDAWAYLRSLPPAKHLNRSHELRFPFGWRFLVGIWKWFFFTPGTGGAAPTIANLIDRGTYLVRVLGHCGECHTPRNFLGGPKSGGAFAGSRIPEGKVPNITPTRLKKWSDDDLLEYFVSGTTPSGDIAVDPMSEVIMNTTGKLTKPDLMSIIAYLRSLPALPDTNK